jgi:hypothetical protein
MATAEVTTSANESPTGKIRSDRHPSPVNIDEVEHTVAQVSCSLPTDFKLVTNRKFNFVCHRRVSNLCNVNNKVLAD